jgi:hypothetical protein
MSERMMGQFKENILQQSVQVMLTQAKSALNMILQLLNQHKWTVDSFV